ncbi:probable ubiquitin-like-specific protease 2B isoform X2 [Selaginella moellendorffii]|uniref:probable ubiquitin-like-specific protease 2B isoform X2 n=1 Tax=Selaginella moellendorffii TaxID=88036 RepID=UPI000D1CF0E4|nr:probable ubiquitin-like-specific protease 2B isoform X2 [Selaginella moellendorffii]|eukprot:XP_024531958.1 probable ubiquitin-like-specific protease 2B isoform X2 [Selaginella moellendorffii]
MADLSVYEFKEEAEEPRPRLMRMIRETFSGGERKRKKKADGDWNPSPASARKNRAPPAGSSVGSRTRSKKAGNVVERTDKGVLPVLSYKNVVQLDDLEEDGAPSVRELDEDKREKDSCLFSRKLEEGRRESAKEELEEKELEEDRKEERAIEELKAEKQRVKEQPRILLQEALSMSRLHSLVYPQDDPDPVTITSNDIDLLRPSAFLNDTIIDFYIKHLQMTMSDDEKAKTYFFNSFFFPKLVDLSALPADEARAAFARLEKWTKKEDIFQKDYIFIPVSRSLHWSLLVICYLSDMLPTDSDLHTVSTRILHFDSLTGFHSDIEPFVRNYLWQEWNRRKTSEKEDRKYHFDQIKFVRVEVPQQDNLHDCGLFLLHYVELFLERCFTSKSSLSLITVNWFDPAEASAKRFQLLRLIHGMLTAKLDSQGESNPSPIHLWKHGNDLNSSPDDAEELVMFHGSSP